MNHSKTSSDQKPTQTSPQLSLTGKLLPVGCVIMASGFGRRFGGNKLLCDFHGKPLIAHILDTIKLSPISRTLVVTRHQEIAELCAPKGFECLIHDLPDRSDTVRLGLQGLLTSSEASTEISGCLFCPADQPLIKPGSLEKLLLAFSAYPDKAYRLGYGNMAGAPVLFGRQFFPELLCLPQGKGGSFLLKKYPGQVTIVPARDEYELYDIDTPEDLEYLSNLPCTSESAL